MSAVRRYKERSAQEGRGFRLNLEVPTKEENVIDKNLVERLQEIFQDGFKPKVVVEHIHFLIERENYLNQKEMLGFERKYLIHFGNDISDERALIAQEICKMIGLRLERSKNEETASRLAKDGREIHERFKQEASEMPVLDVFPETTGEGARPKAQKSHGSKKSNLNGPGKPEEETLHRMAENVCQTFPTLADWMKEQELKKVRLHLNDLSHDEIYDDLTEILDSTSMPFISKEEVNEIMANTDPQTRKLVYWKNPKTKEWVEKFTNSMPSSLNIPVNPNSRGKMDNFDYSQRERSQLEVSDQDKERIRQLRERRKAREGNMLPNPEVERDKKSFYVRRRIRIKLIVEMGFPVMFPEENGSRDHNHLAYQVFMASSTDMTAEEFLQQALHTTFPGNLGKEYKASQEVKDIMYGTARAWALENGFEILRSASRIHLRCQRTLLDLDIKKSEGKIVFRLLLGKKPAAGFILDQILEELYALNLIF